MHEVYRMQYKIHHVNPSKYAQKLHFSCFSLSITAISRIKYICIKQKMTNYNIVLYFYTINV